jgi:hypothetical protein
MTTTADETIADYLDDLRDALVAADVPKARRRELVAEIEAHIAQARPAFDDPFSVAEVRTLLDRLGPPEAIAAEEAGDATGGADAPTPPAAAAAAGGAWREPAAIVLLLFGGFGAGVGWLVGVILLWASPRWTTGDKLAGTLLWPGGLSFVTIAILYVLGTSSSATSCDADRGGGFADCTASNGYLAPLLLLVLVLAVPFLTAIFLAVRLKPRA